MKKGLLTFFLVIGLIALSADSGFACDYCLLSQGISPLDTIKGAGVRVNQRYTLMDQVYRGTEELANPGVKEEYWTTEVTGFFSVNEDFTILGVLPYKKNGMDGELHVHSDGAPEAHSDMQGDSSGLGDVSVIGRYSFFKRHTIDEATTVAALLGIKLPTGSTDARTNDGMEFLDSHLQPGTGSTDFMAGISFSHAVQRVSVSANLLGVIPTEGKSGDKYHRFGNALNYDLTAKYRVYPGPAGPAGPQLFLALGVNGELRGREKENGETVTNSGGNTAYLSPGIQVVAGPRLVFEFTYHKAVYHNLYGTQLGEDHKASGGVTYLF